MVHVSKRLFTYIDYRYNSWCKLGMYTKGKHSPYTKAISVSGYRQCAQRDSHKQKAALIASLFILALLIQKPHLFLLICLSVILFKKIYRCRFPVMLQSIIIEDEQQYSHKLDYNKELLLCLSHTIFISVNWHTHVSCSYIYPHCDLHMLVLFNVRTITYTYIHTQYDKSGNLILE